MNCKALERVEEDLESIYKDLQQIEEIFDIIRIKIKDSHLEVGRLIDINWREEA